MVSQASLLVEFRFAPRSCRTEWVWERPEPERASGTAANTAPEAPAGPAADPDPGPDPAAPADPAADDGRGDNGLGNGGETSQNEDPNATGDPSNPGVGGSGPSGGGKGRGKV